MSRPHIRKKKQNYQQWKGKLFNLKKLIKYKLNKPLSLRKRINTNLRNFKLSNRLYIRKSKRNMNLKNKKLNTSFG